MQLTAAAQVNKGIQNLAPTVEPETQTETPVPIFLNKSVHERLLGK